MSKSTGFWFLRKILMIPKIGSTLVNLSESCESVFFSNCTWWQSFKSELKSLFWIFKKNPYYDRNGVTKVFLEPKSTLLDIFSLNLLFRFFWNCAWWPAFKIGKMNVFFIFKEDSHYAGNGSKWVIFGFKDNLSIWR